MNYFFVALLVSCSVYAFVAGGAPERIGAAVYALSCVATHAVLEVYQVNWRFLDVGVFIIDVATLAFFCVLALRVDRFWPMWVSGLLGLGVLAHFARWYAGSDIGWWPYAVSLTIWSYPILAIIAAGTLNHQRRVARSRAAATAPRETA